jgi:hypothetical protein
MLTFDFRKTEKDTRAEWARFGSMRIFDVIV